MEKLLSSNCGLNIDWAGDWSLIRRPHLLPYFVDGVAQCAGLSGTGTPGRICGVRPLQAQKIRCKWASTLDFARIVRHTLPTTLNREWSKFDDFPSRPSLSPSRSRPNVTELWRCIEIKR